MKEELTTQMHSEFSISEETDIRHRCFCALKDIKDFSYTLEKVCVLYNVTPKQIETHKKEFIDLLWNY